MPSIVPFTSASTALTGGSWMISRASDAAEGLRAERIAGRLVLAGPRVVRQAAVESILADFP